MGANTLWRSEAQTVGTLFATSRGKHNEEMSENKLVLYLNVRADLVIQKNSLQFNILFYIILSSTSALVTNQRVLVTNN